MMDMPLPAKSSSSSRARSSAGSGRAAGPALKFVTRVMAGSLLVSGGRHVTATGVGTDPGRIIPLDDMVLILVLIIYAAGGVFSRRASPLLRSTTRMSASRLL